MIKENKLFVVYFKINNEIGRLHLWKREGFWTSLATELSISTFLLRIALKVSEVYGRAEDPQFTVLNSFSFRKKVNIVVSNTMVILTWIMEILTELDI